ncbi:hypothetical protein HN020_03200 [Brevibacillus borstelensis]|uniref:hypothetical protein n=1 Tax=Brevibacillus TaxID=55080 RepID=UPI00148F5DBC|nr:hypothetical protein [Brevibacillus borstelensis]MCC0566255.1 hypothetical protein [Brevibacillus borstelensis]MED1854793.1 hypothetical protein [Brevibacillus borstelensis]NOU53805.1 hypothetical protein [Brevibacillus borstelensis]
MNNSVVQAFRNQFLNAFGIQLPRIVQHSPTEITTIRGEKHIVEDLFRMENDTLLHVEYQSSPNPKDLDQLFFDLMWYDLKIGEKHGKLINTIVVFGSEILDVELGRDLGAIKYRATGAVWLSKQNGDQITEELTKKVEQKGELTDEELSKLVLLPAMYSTGSRLEITMKAVQIANKLADHGKRDLVIKLMKVMAGRLLLTSDDYEQVVQALAKA